MCFNWKSILLVKKKFLRIPSPIPWGLKKDKTCGIYVSGLMVSDEVVGETSGIPGCPRCVQQRAKWAERGFPWTIVQQPHLIMPVED